MFCRVLRLEAFILLSAAQQSGNNARDLKPPHLFQGRTVMVNLGTHDGHNLIGPAETGVRKRKTW